MPKIELDETECGQVIDTNLSSVTYFLKWTNDQARSRSFPYQCLLQRDSKDDAYHFCLLCLQARCGTTG